MSEKKFQSESRSESREGVDAVLDRMWEAVGKPPLSYELALDISQSDLKNWRRRGRVSRRYLEEFALQHGCSLAWLLRGERDQKATVVDIGRRAESPAAAYSVQPLPDDYVFLPRHDVRAGAGSGQVVLADDSVIDHLAFRRNWIVGSVGLDPLNAALIEVRGDSMQPTLNDGDLILVDLRNSHRVQAGVYVIQYAGHLLVKRLAPRMDGSVEVISDNPAYGSEHLSAEAADSLTVVGRVVWSGGKI